MNPVPKFLPPSPIAAVLSAIFIAILAVIAAIIFAFNPYAESPPVVPTPADQVEQDTSIGVPASSCATVSADKVPDCCEAWATENELVRIRCVGEWQLQNNECSYVCASE